MRQFQVPQFITVEDKVIGPFTIKQFVFIGTGALLVAFIRTIFEGLILYILMIVIGAFAVALAFLKINDQSLPLIIKNAALFFLHPRLYVWKQEDARKKNTSSEKQKDEVAVTALPKLSVSKLNDLAWSLDLKEKPKDST